MGGVHLKCSEIFHHFLFFGEGQLPRFSPRLPPPLPGPPEPPPGGPRGPLPPPPPPPPPALTLRFCRSMPGRWLEKLRLFAEGSFPVISRSTTPPPPPPPPPLPRWWGWWEEYDFPPPPSLSLNSVKSLLSEAVSHSSLAWSEFWLVKSGDLAPWLWWCWG